LIDLRSDAQALRQLPRHAAPPELSDSMIFGLPDDCPVVLPALRRPKRKPPIFAISLAASVMLAVGVGIWFMAPARDSTPIGPAAGHPGPRTTDLALTGRNSVESLPVARNELGPKTPEPDNPIVTPSAPLPAPSKEIPPPSRAALASPALNLPEP